MAAGINHVTLMFSPQGMTPTTNDMYRAYFAAAASALKIEQTIVPVENVTDIVEMFAALARSQNPGVVIPPDTFMIASGTLISSLAARHSLPIIYSVRRVVAEGGLMSYGPDPLEWEMLPSLHRNAIGTSE
jgi:ABC-type uncharacterized transport system substrate-binding protein